MIVLKLRKSKEMKWPMFPKYYKHVYFELFFILNIYFQNVCYGRRVEHFNYNLWVFKVTPRLVFLRTSMLKQLKLKKKYIRGK